MSRYRYKRYSFPHRRVAVVATRVIVRQTGRPTKVYEGRVPPANAVQSVIAMDANSYLFRDEHTFQVIPIAGANYSRMTLVNRQTGKKVEEPDDEPC